MNFVDFVRMLKCFEDTGCFKDFKVTISSNDWPSNVTDINIDFELKTIDLQ